MSLHPLPRNQAASTVSFTDFPLPRAMCPPPQRDPYYPGIGILPPRLPALPQAGTEDALGAAPSSSDAGGAPPSSGPPGLARPRPHRVPNSPARPQLLPPPACGNSRLPGSPGSQ